MVEIPIRTCQPNFHDTLENLWQRGRNHKGLNCGNFLGWVVYLIRRQRIQLQNSCPLKSRYRQFCCLFAQSTSINHRNNPHSVGPGSDLTLPNDKASLVLLSIPEKNAFPIIHAEQQDELCRSHIFLMFQHVFLFSLCHQIELLTH